MTHKEDIEAIKPIGELLQDRIDYLQAEIEKKDKIIDEMANHIVTCDSDLCQYLDITTKCKYYAGENKKTCDNCIKEYFKKYFSVIYGKHIYNTIFYNVLELHHLVLKYY